jgi:hypothetical protein
LKNALQFRAYPSNLEGHACDGRWHYIEALGNGRHGESARGLGDLAMIEKQKKENDLIKLIDAALNWPISNAVRAELQSFNTPMIASMPSSSANGF